jgi:hypothetical protein
MEKSHHRISGAGAGTGMSLSPPAATAAGSSKHLSQKSGFVGAGSDGSSSSSGGRMGSSSPAVDRP